MTKIPFYKPTIGAEEIDAVIDTLKSGWITTGPKTKQFEASFADYLHHKHAVAVNSCTAALHLALEAIGLQAGQGVVVPTMTFAATAEVVRYFGARPILVDCRVEDFNLDVADAERKIQAAVASGQSVAAIMPVHYGGQIGDVAGVRSLAQRYNLKIVEDAAHCCPAFYREKSVSRREDGEVRESDLGGQTSEVGGKGRGAVGGGKETEDGGRRTEGGGRGTEVGGRRSDVGGQGAPVSGTELAPNSDWLTVGTGADISCYSFYANKTITTGEGGMACTANDEYADRMRIMSLHGISKDAWKRFTAEGSWYYEILAPGFKYNLTDIASAMGIQQLRKADLFHQRRTELVRLYRAGLEDVEEIILPQAHPDRIHSWHLHVIRLKLSRLSIDRGQFITELQRLGVGTSVHWMPLHMHPYYRETYGYAPQDLPVAAALYPEIITLPLYPDMTEDQVRYVCDAIREVICRNRSGRSRRTVVSSQWSVVSQ